MNVRCDCAGCVYENQKAGEDPCYRCLHESEYIYGGPESHSYPQSKATSAADVAEVRYCGFVLEEARRRESVYKCSACGNYLTVRSDTLNGGRSDINYCPFCGRKVLHKGQDGGQDDV